MTKSSRYYYDADAVREKAEYGRRKWSSVEGNLAAATTAGDKRLHHGVRVSASVTGADPSAGRNRRSVWTIATAPYPGAHFATFPPALVQPCIKAGCPEGGTVLDPFMGSGTTGDVALRHSCKFIGIELSEEYIQLAMKRFDQKVLF
tara:strand:- start:2290 stop:2730 length:441 start_codon:yes stop_codon:yes gene_type:complete